MTEISPRAVEQLQDLFRRVDALERSQKPLSSQASATRQPQSQQIMLGKPTANLAAGDTGTFEIWSRGDGAKGSEVATGEFVLDVYNPAFALTTEDLAYIDFIDGGLESSKRVC